MDEEEWNSLRDLSGILEHFDIATSLITKEKYPTLHVALPVFNYVMEQLKGMRNQNIALKDGIKIALDKLNLYYSKTENSAYYIGTGKLYDTTFLIQSVIDFNE
jgi:hypothetical protein